MSAMLKMSSIKVNIGEYHAGEEKNEKLKNYADFGTFLSTSSPPADFFCWSIESATRNQLKISRQSRHSEKQKKNVII